MATGGGGGGTDLGAVTLSWTEGESTVGAKLELWESSTNEFVHAKKLTELNLGTTSTVLQRLTGSVWNYWLRYRLPNGDLGTEVACLDNPVTYPPPAPL